LEKNLWANIATGDKESYSEAYVFYYKKLYNYGRKITDDIPMIEDSINEVFIMIWTNRETLHKILSPQSYIFSSFRNNLFRKIKSARTIPLSEDEQQTEVHFSIDTIIIQRETDAALKATIEKALQQLTDRQREAIFLRFYEGLSYIEIAGVMNISVKATYKIMARALSELKEGFSIPTALLLTMLKQLI
jgi:RNA polymerase sigma factor (sigma-70 family)